MKTRPSEGIGKLVGKEAIKVHFATTRPDLRQALRDRCRKSPAFLRLLQAAASDLVRRDRPNPLLTGNTPRATRVLEYAVDALSQKHKAQVPEGAAAVWCYLVPKKRKATNGKIYQILSPVSKLEAMLVAQSEATLDGFKVRRLLGYTPTISRKAAR